MKDSRERSPRERERKDGARPPRRRTGGSRAVEPFGLLVVDKPEGPTSHDVVDAVRRACSIRRVGHTGTLDPMATGVLVLCLGRATRLAEFLTGHDKRYTGAILFGAATDTFDAEGRVTETASRIPSEAELIRALRGFRGVLSQRPPAFSAVRTRGERAHVRARRGDLERPPPREVTIRRLELLGYEQGVATIDVVCSSGTYIRSLAHDLGRAAGSAAHLASLRRTECGPFRVSDAVPLDEFLAAGRAGLSRWLRPVREGLADAPLVELSGADAARVADGRAIRIAGRRDERLFACAPDDSWVAVLEYDRGRGGYRPRKFVGTRPQEDRR